jgi:hypothetical protein
MGFPIKICSKCSEEFELRPGKPGFAHECPACSEPQAEKQEPVKGKRGRGDKEANEARREAMRNLLYRKDS